ncbi:MAG TPA: hypothetical protein VIJ68_03225 [Candidatus Saccharimonadales bacterium]
MDPSNKEGSGLGSMSPPPEQVLVPVGGTETAPNPEQAASGPERAPAPLGAPSTAVPAAPAATIPLPTPAPVSAVSGVSAASQAAALAADDGDLIEKEWVVKAKQIVERTRDDPYKQSEDLTLFKADYMKKRYGKTIKVSR